MTKISTEKSVTISQVRREVGLPIALLKILILRGEVEVVKAVDGTIRITERGLRSAREFAKSPRQKLRVFFRALGPGLITGASDDDPSGIGTYSSVGAMFGLGLLWMAVWLLPMMLAIQETCARIGIVTNRGLTTVLKEEYSKKIVMVVVLLLVVANIVNIGADLGAMAASLRMISGINFDLGVVLFALIIVLLEVFVQYHLYVKVLKWLTISVFAYILTGFIIKPHWSEIFAASIIPHFQFSRDYFFAVIAVFGTSITPYLFFWQASEEVEDGKLFRDKKEKHVLRHRLVRMRTDVNAGMLLANVVFFFIILTTASVLFQHGITNINSAEEAALALKPLAGNFAYLLFALGIIGTGLLAVPVLAGASAYAMAEIMNWHEGLEKKFAQARGFYVVATASVFVGILLNFLRINPIAALYYAAFLNGIIALPLLVVIMLVGNNRKIMGHETHPHWVKFFGWLAVGFMVVSVIALVGISIYQR